VIFHISQNSAMNTNYNHQENDDDNLLQQFQYGDYNVIDITES